MTAAIFETLKRIRATNECTEAKHSGTFDRNKCKDCQPCLCKKKHLEYYGSIK